MEGVILQILELSDLSKDDIELLKIFAKQNTQNQNWSHVFTNSQKMAILMNKPFFVSL